MANAAEFLVGRSVGHEWAVFMATSGHFSWPPVGRSSWPLTSLVVVPITDSFRGELVNTSRAALMLLTESLVGLLVKRQGESAQAAQSATLSVLSRSLTDCDSSPQHLRLGLAIHRDPDSARDEAVRTRGIQRMGAVDDAW